MTGTLSEPGIILPLLEFEKYFLYSTMGYNIGFAGLFPLASALEKIVLFLDRLIELFCFGTKEQRNVRWRPCHTILN